MDWIDSLGSGAFLRRLFPIAPSLQGLRLFEVSLHEDGPRVLLRFDLNDFPTHPPTEWIQSKANRVQVELMGIGVQDFELRGWSTSNVADIVIEPEDSGRVRFTAHGAKFHVSGRFEFLVVRGVSAYLDVPS